MPQVSYTSGAGVARVTAPGRQGGNSTAAGVGSWTNDLGCIPPASSSPASQIQDPAKWDVSAPPVVYDDLPAGGLVLDGTASTARAFDTAPAGGLVMGGQAAVSRAFDTGPAGGIVLGGTSTGGIVRDVAPAGGIVLGGSAATLVDRAVSPAGGIVLGGALSSAIARDVTPAGGLVLGGTTTTARELAVSPAGGIVLGGSVTTVYIGPTVYTDAPAGGVVFGGVATSDLAIASAEPSIVETLWPGGGGDDGELLGLPKPRRPRRPRFDPPPPFRPAPWPERVARSVPRPEEPLLQPEVADTLLEETVELLVLGLV